MFILFILSHGSSDGRVFTDHPLVAGADKGKLEQKDTESYLVSDLWDGLKSMSLTNDCLFLLMLGVSGLSGYINVSFCLVLLHSIRLYSHFKIA